MRFLGKIVGGIPVTEWVWDYINPYSKICHPEASGHRYITNFKLSLMLKLFVTYVSKRNYTIISFKHSNIGSGKFLPYSLISRLITFCLQFFAKTKRKGTLKAVWEI
jgi:hypothetical protein